LHKQIVATSTSTARFSLNTSKTGLPWLPLHDKWRGMEILTSEAFAKINPTEDKDEINKREVCECDGWVCDLDMMGVPSKLSVIRKDHGLVRVRNLHVSHIIIGMILLGIYMTHI
jgi:hypothetical protein